MSVTNKYPDGKVCTKCLESKPVTEFSRRSTSKATYQSWCKSCTQARDQLVTSPANQARAQRKRARRDELYAKVRELKDTPCVDCGQRFPSVCMDFDHVNGDKVGNIATMISNAVSWDRLEVEIAKCEIVCANCHRIRTAARRQY